MSDFYLVNDAETSTRKCEPGVGEGINEGGSKKIEGISVTESKKEGKK